MPKLSSGIKDTYHHVSHLANVGGVGGLALRLLARLLDAVGS
jgi:hypothetical protein